MRVVAGTLLAILLPVVVLFASVAHAQQEGVEEATEVVYLKGEDGKLHAVLGMPLDDFYKLLKAQAVAQQVPQPSLSRLIVQGKVNDQRAEIDIELTAQLAQDNQNPWIRLPLLMGTAILREDVRYEGPGKFMLVYDGTGYVAWIQNAGSEPHHLHLKMFVPVKVVGHERRLRLTLPRATQSQLSIDLPIKGLRPTVLEGGSFDPPLATEAGTQIRAAGLGGDFQLTWQKENPASIAQGTALEVEGAVLVRFEKGRVQSRANLRVKSFGKPIDRFEVTLPQATRLISEGNNGYELAEIEMPKQASSDEKSEPEAGPRRVEVKLDQPTVGPIDVQLVVERTHHLNEPGSRLPLSGFSVANAVRQWGHVALQVEGDWQLRWATQRDILRVDKLPETLADEEVTAAFEYTNQPYQLDVQISRPTTRTTVEPQYVLDVSAEKVTLHGRLAYRVRGAKTFELLIDLPGWEVDTATVGPAANVRADEIEQDDQGQLKIPLTSGLKGDFNIEFSAQRAISKENDPLRISLPQVVADVTSAATVVVLPADNVQLAPRRDELEGLAPMPIAVDIDLPQRQQRPFFYQSEQAEAEFVAKVQVLPRTVAVEVDSKAVFNDTFAEVTQTLDYDISNEPIESLRLLVPRELADEQRMTVSLDGKEHELFVIDSPTEPADEKTVALGLSLPEPRIGELTLTIQYPWKLTDPNPQENTLLMVPLVMPGEGTLLNNYLELHPRAGIQTDVDKSLWSLDESGEPSLDESSLQRFVTQMPVQHAELFVKASEQSSAATVIIHRAWIQTYLTQEGRLDFATYTLQAPSGTIRIQLPRGVRREDIRRVNVDGHRVEPFVELLDVTKRPELQITLPPSGNSEHRLELSYVVPQEKPNRSRMTFETPRFEKGTWVDEMAYWELILPDNQHLVAPPESGTPAFEWKWQRFVWGRAPLLSHRELADWIGTSFDSNSSVDGQVASGQAGRYLFSSFNVGQDFEVRTASSATMILLSAGAVLSAGLLLLHVPALRQPGVLFTASLILLTAGILFPEPALLAAQAGAIGIVLVAISALLSRLLTLRTKREPMIRGGDGSTARLRVTDFSHVPQEVGSSTQRTTVSMPAVLPPKEPASSQS